MGQVHYAERELFLFSLFIYFGSKYFQIVLFIYLIFYQTVDHCLAEDWNVIKRSEGPDPV